MAVNMSRSQNADLAEGMSDGRYKKITPDRGGVVEAATYRDRRDLSDMYYGIHEAATKALPDATVHATPGYVVTPAVRVP